MTEQPLVSVVIPAKNAAATIEATLSSLRDQGYPNLQVIVCDGGSTDATVELARRAGVVVCEAGNERSNQVNVGARTAEGRYIYYVAADITFEPGMLNLAVESCERGYDGVAIPVRAAGDNFWARVKWLERECYRGDDLIVGLRFMRREVFDALGGYDPAIVAGEDYDLHNRFVAAGYRWSEIEPSEVHWGEPRTVAEILRKSFYYGRTFRAYIGKHPGRAARQLQPLRAAFLRNWRLMLRHPVLTLGLVAFKFLQYGAGGAGLLFPIRLAPGREAR
jgi:glycosyltransferase involved in cell wall biosynthesis